MFHMLHVVKSCEVLLRVSLIVTQAHNTWSRLRLLWPWVKVDRSSSFKTYRLATYNDAISIFKLPSDRLLGLYRDVNTSVINLWNLRGYWRQYHSILQQSIIQERRVWDKLASKYVEAKHVVPVENQYPGIHSLGFQILKLPRIATWDLIRVG